MTKVIADQICTLDRARGWDALLMKGLKEWVERHFLVSILITIFASSLSVSVWALSLPILTQWLGSFLIPVLTPAVDLGFIVVIIVLVSIFLLIGPANYVIYGVFQPRFYKMFVELAEKEEKPEYILRSYLNFQRIKKYSLSILILFVFGTWIIDQNLYLRHLFSSFLTWDRILWFIMLIVFLLFFKLDLSNPLLIRLSLKASIINLEHLISVKKDKAQEIPKISEAPLYFREALKKYDEELSNLGFKMKSPEIFNKRINFVTLFDTSREVKRIKGIFEELHGHSEDHLNFIKTLGKLRKGKNKPYSSEEALTLLELTRGYEPITRWIKDNYNLIAGIGGALTILERIYVVIISFLP